MFSITAEPLRMEQLFELISDYDPEHLPRLFDLLRMAFQADEESRSRCAPLAEALADDNLDSAALACIYLDASREEARELWAAELVALSPEELHSRVGAERSGVLWGLAELLALEGRCTLRQDPAASMALTDLASRAARRAPLLPHILSARERQQLEGLTLAFQANGERAADRTAEARHLFETALRPFETIDTFGFLPTILSLQASLEISQREYFQALASLDSALARTEDSRQKARVHLKRSIVWGHTGDEFLALEEVERASTLLTTEPDSKLHYYVAQSRAALLSQMGRIDDAAALLPGLRHLLDQLDSPVETLQVRWVEARIALGQERSTEGEALYRRAREGFLEMELPYRAAVVTVEFARHLFEQQRFQEVAQLAAESVAEFRRQGVQQEVLGAVALLEDANRGQVSLEIVGQILKRVRRAARER
jgi:tetratricopeptide (TPR) repeat protein